MDINMPVMNGIEATKRTKADVPDTAIIGLSVQGEEELHDQIPDVGGPECLCAHHPRWRVVNLAMGDLPKLKSHARAVPYLVNGAMNGFRLDFIAPSSFYEKIGLKYGDVLQQVKGVNIRDSGTMFTLFQQLRNE